MRSRVGAVLVSLYLAGCGGQSVVTNASGTDAGADSGAPAFPTGTYTSCAEGLRDNMLNLAGFEEGATLTVAADGDALRATYVDMNGVTSTLGFAPTSSTSARLAGTGAVTAGFAVQCVQGVGSVGSYPATLDVTDGALTYAAGTVFLTVTGTVHGDAGPCGPVSAPATFWVVAADGPVAQPDGAVATPSATGLAGSYACISQVETAYESGGMKQFVAGGGENGTLMLTGEGATLQAAYSGDTALAGTLHFDVATDTTATATASQSVTVPCEVPIGMGAPPPQTSGTLSVGAASISALGTTLFLSFSGAMNASSACAGARKAGSVICTRQ